MEAKADRSESARDQKFSAAVETLKTLFKGNVHGRLDDLCKPTNRKFDLAASIVLGGKYVSTAEARASFPCILVVPPLHRADAAPPRPGRFAQ